MLTVINSLYFSIITLEKAFPKQVGKLFKSLMTLLKDACWQGSLMQ